MMWANWLFWILVGGLVLLMFTRGGCGGHSGHGGPGNDGGHDGHEGTGSGKDAHGTAVNRARGGCH